MPRKSILTLLFLALALAGSAAAFAQAGSLDPDFGLGGLATWAPAVGDANVYGMATDDRGAIVLVGRTVVDGRRSLLVMRLLPDGSLDPSFGDGGVAVPDLPVEMEGIDVAFHGPGAILIAGTVFYDNETSDIGLVRLRRNGQLQTRFGEGGIAIADRSAIDIAAAVVSRGGFYVIGQAGSSRAGIVKFTSQGKVNTRFGDDGWLTLPCHSFSSGEDAVVQGRRIVVAARCDDASGRYDFALFGVKPVRGALDPRFGEGGLMRMPLDAEYSHAYTVDVQPDGRLLAGGQVLTNSAPFEFSFAVARAEADGSGLDPTFGTGGLVTAEFTLWNDTVWDVTTDLSGRILAVGRANATGFSDWDFTVLRYLPDGTPDPDFGDAGVVQTGDERYEDARAVAVQRDGRILAAGSRYSGDPGFLPLPPPSIDTDVMVVRYLGVAAARTEINNFVSEIDTSAADGGVDGALADTLVGMLDMVDRLVDAGHDDVAASLLSSFSSQLSLGAAIGILPADKGRRWSGWAEMLARSL